MTQLLALHPETPQPRLLERAAHVLHEGGLVALPTDCCWALACRVGDVDALTRLRQIREMNDRHHLTLMCRDLSQIAQYARVDNRQYRLLKATTPGSYVFILEGTHDLPRKVLHPKRKTIGLRVPDNKLALALLAAFEAPLLSATLLLPGQDEPLGEGWEVADALEGRIELVLDDGSHCGATPSTVIDLTGDAPELLRQGKGDIAPFGFDPSFH